jgi:acylpyruvate hydrolase
MSKPLDSTGRFGPCLITPDELPPGAAGLRIRSRLNDPVMQNGYTSEAVNDSCPLADF